MDDKTVFMFDGCKYELRADGYRPISRLVDFLRECCRERGYEFISNPRAFYDPVEQYMKSEGYNV